MQERIKTDRSIWPYIFLSIVTFGIYGIWYLHKLRKDVNIMCMNDNKHTPDLLVLCILSVLTCGIYSMIWWCNMHDRMRSTAKELGVRVEQTTSNLMLLFIGAYFCLGILSWVAIHKVFTTANELAVAYNRSNGHYT